MAKAQKTIEELEKLAEETILNQDITDEDMLKDPVKAAAFLQARKLAKENREEDKKNQINLEARKANAAEMERNRKERMLQQNACLHRKDNGRTALAGQRAHNQTLILHCQKCMKEFYGSEVPLDLRPPAEFVGGPIL